MWTVVYAQTAGAPGEGPGISFLLIMVVMMVAMFFIVYLPNQRREKERRQMLGGMAKGDDVITSGGIHGKVVGLTDHDVVLRVDENVDIRFMREAVVRVLSKKNKDEETKN